MSGDAARSLRAALVEVDERLASLERTHARVVEASWGSNADDEHDPEGATIAVEREQVTSLLRAGRASRAQLLASLALLDAGGEVTCEGCGGPIAPERLAARPAARTCIACARAAPGRR